MIRSIAGGVIFILMSSAAIASALESPHFCCACVQTPFAQAGGAPINRTTGSAAVFCVATTNNGTAVEAQDRCNALTGHILECVTDGNNSCHNDLAQAGILCPTTGAPTAGGASLLALAVVLAAGGAFFLRRLPTRGQR